MDIGGRIGSNRASAPPARCRRRGLAGPGPLAEHPREVLVDAIPGRNDLRAGGIDGRDGDGGGRRRRPSDLARRRHRRAGPGLGPRAERGEHRGAHQVAGVRRRSRPASCRSSTPTPRSRWSTSSGPIYYNFWKDAQHKRGLWRRTTLDEYRKAEPAWETVIDLDALGADEKVNWVWHGASALKPGYERCLISLSRGGADADVKREYDLKAKAFVEGGFTLPEAKSRVAWRGDRQRLRRHRLRAGVADQVGLSPDRQGVVPRHAARPGHARLRGPGRRHERRGLSRPDPGFERDFVSRRITFYSGETFLRRDGKLIKLEVPDDAEVDVERELLLVTLRTDWKVGGKTYPAGSLISTDFEGSSEAGRSFDVLFEPTDRKSLAGFRRPRISSCSTSWTTSATASTSWPTRTASGRASRSRGPPRSARRTPRRSTPTSRTTSS